MNKLVKYLFIMCTFSPVCYAQNNIPNWISSEGREKAYPANEWYWGMAIEVGVSSVNIEKAKQVAIGNIARQIYSIVENDAIYEKESKKSNLEERVRSLFYNKISITSSQISLSNIGIDTYYEKDRDIVHVFAYVNRRYLESYYLAQIEQNLLKAESSYEMARLYQKNNKKPASRNQCIEVTNILEEIKYLQDLATAIVSDTKQLLLYSNRCSMLQREAGKLMMEIDGSPYNSEHENYWTLGFGTGMTHGFLGVSLKSRWGIANDFGWGISVGAGINYGLFSDEEKSDRRFDEENSTVHLSAGVRGFYKKGFVSINYGNGAITREYGVSLLLGVESLNIFRKKNGLNISIGPFLGGGEVKFGLDVAFLLKL